MHKSKDDVIIIISIAWNPPWVTCRGCHKRTFPKRLQYKNQGHKNTVQILRNDNTNAPTKLGHRHGWNMHDQDSTSPAKQWNVSATGVTRIERAVKREHGCYKPGSHDVVPVFMYLKYDGAMKFHAQRQRIFPPTHHPFGFDSSAFASTSKHAFIASNWCS